jgi:leader peptidase (prepilin peptidase)/N-methyltransferase
LRGRCRHCGVHISARYPLVELGTALLFALVAWLIVG